MTLKYLVALAAVSEILIGGESGAAAAPRPLKPHAQEAISHGLKYIEPIDAISLAQVRAVFRCLIEAEDTKNIEKVRRLTWKSPSTLLVDKIATVGKGNWPGVWGDEGVTQRLHGVINGNFQIDPDYSKIKIVGLTHDLAEVYAPVQIVSADAGETPVSKRVLMIVDWIRTPQGWKMASNFAIPIPLSQERE